MRKSLFWAAAALSVYNNGGSLVQAQTTMDSPASWTFPTTRKTTYLTTTTGTAALTIDDVTVLDPWPTSPDPELVPHTMYETAITHRTIIPSPSSTPQTPNPEEPQANTTITTMITSRTTYLLWAIYAFDMSPYTLPTCPGPENCAYSSIKPSGTCEELGPNWQTRCAGQCLLKDWMWWCTKVGEDDLANIRGRVCDDGGGGTNATLVQLVEPCDHTDWKAGCLKCAEDEEVIEFPDF
ncbi:hypothetical protein V8F20_001434 [Naviculisporaceae sp. PSN 640]